MDPESISRREDRPNFNREKTDIMAELTAAQYEFDSLDEFDRISYSLSFIRDINKQIEQQEILLVLETRQLGVRGDESSELYTFVKVEDEEPFVARGQLKAIDVGWFDDTSGYTIILRTLIKSPHEKDKYIECDAYIHMKTLLGYSYMKLGDSQSAQQ